MMNSKRTRPRSESSLTRAAVVRIITADLTTVQERGKYLGIVSAAWGIFSSLGGIIGGAIVSVRALCDPFAIAEAMLSQAVSWRYLFYINVPFCGITALIIYLYLDMPPVKHISLSQHLAQWLVEPPKKSLPFS